MTNPVRVAIVITDSGIGGTEKVISSLIDRLDRSRYVPVGVCVLKSSRENARAWSAKGVPVTAFGMKKWPTPSVVSGVKRQLVAWRADLVHSFLFHAIQTTRLLKMAGARWALVSSPRVNYAFAPRLALIADRMVRRWDDGVLCESAAGRNYLVNTLGYRSDTTYVAVNGVDGDVYRATTSGRNRVRAEWGVPEGTLLVGSIGRLHPQKGFDVLASAASKLQDLRVPFQVAIVGDGPDRSSLQNTIDALDVPVRLAGFRGDIADVLSAIDIYVQSSRYEGLSNALLEAMSCGRACVATAVDGTLDFAQDGKNMVLVRPNHEASLALGIATLLEKADLRRQLAENATITAREFTVDRMIRGFESAYDSVLKFPGQMHAS